MKSLKKTNGSSHHSIMALARKRAVAELAATLAAQGDTAAAGLVERLAPVLEEGEEMPDVRLLFRLLERLAKRAEDDLEKADTGRWLAGMELETLRRESRRAKEALYAEAVKVRKTLVELYGSARCRFQFGLSKRTPRGAASLAEEARRLVARLASPGLVLPPAELPGVKPDATGWADALRPGLERLDALLEELERRRIAADDRVIGRQKALEACDETYLEVARTTETLFALAGEKELARRVRPPARPRKRHAARALLEKPAARLLAAAVAIVHRLRGFLVRLPREWLESHKPAVWQLARGSWKPRIG